MEVVQNPEAFADSSSVSVSLSFVGCCGRCFRRCPAHVSFPPSSGSWTELPSSVLETWFTVQAGYSYIDSVWEEDGN